MIEDLVASLIGRISEGAVLAPLFGLLAGALLSLAPISLPSVPVVISVLAPGTVTDTGQRERPRLFAALPRVVSFVAQGCASVRASVTGASMSSWCCYYQTSKQPSLRRSIETMCMNKRVLIGLGVVAVAVLAFWPRAFGAAAPLLLLAACPLSMVFMMRSMSGGKQGAASADSPAETSTSTSTSTSGAVPTADGTPQTRELEEEVGRLRAELHLRDQRSTS